MSTPTASVNSNVRIMVVDDHPGTATTLARAISQLNPNLEVLSATSGQEALDKMDNSAVDVLITDMMMPKMNGLELIERLQVHPAGRPAHVILITAYNVPGLKETARRLKVDETVIKPVHPERIRQIIGNYLEAVGHRPVVPVQTGEIRSSRILVADDSADNLTLMSRYMQSEGYEFITATNGVEALEKIRAEMPDLVLLDVNMPEKDGFVVLEELRADPAIEHIPVIIFTAARLNPSDVQEGLNLGADDYITKPFDRRELFARIRSKLRVKEMDDVLRRRNRELGILPEISRELSARPDINDLLSIVLRRSVETLGAISGHILIMDSGDVSTKKSYSTSDVQMDFPKLDGFLNDIQETHQGLVVRDTRQDVRWQAGQINLVHSAVIVPMFGRNILLGLLVLTHERADYFGTEHLLLLQAIAGQAAIAIENTQLFSSVAKEQKRMAAVLQSAADAILLFDADDCLTLLNPAGEKLFTDYDAKLGFPLARGCGYDSLLNLLDDTWNSKSSKVGEVAWPDKRTFSALLTPIEEGGCVIVLHDVTRFKDLERIKNEFIATASHDLKNPISVIAGFSDLLAKAGPLNEMQTDFLNRIHSASKTMEGLVMGMLNLARMDLNSDTRLKYEDVNLNVLLSDLTDEFQPQAGVKEQVLTFKKLTEEIVTKADPFQLRQALCNLIGNAIKYTPVKGSIEIFMETGKGSVDVNVKDNGYGIPAADLPFIFDRFYRVRSDDVKDIEGNGLGLAIVKSIIEQHGGQVCVESTPGKGSCFKVSLPILADNLHSPDNLNLSHPELPTKESYYEKTAFKAS